MLSNGPVRQLASTVVAVAALAASLAACDSSEQTGKSKGTSAQTKLCGANLSAGTRRALLDALGSRTYDWEWTNRRRLGDPTEPDQKSLGDAAKKLVAGFRATGTDEYQEYPLCYASDPSVATTMIDLSFFFRKAIPESPASQLTSYKLGKLSLARSSRAYLYMECSSGKFGSGDEPVLIQAKLGRFRPPARESETKRMENLNVLHAVSLAMAKELGCKDDAGLPARFSAPRKT
ncbi:hypothetical protein JHN63_16060 [Streptomyces sp. MBT65]|uniref:hypothetical protein n=1 Tax=Streptomyces sp. MBT65 TaxID=1488395 RepID=UPI00190AD0B6|nr:hypothetical protein [Streptomyces sp. MBT65]MBK3575301.1 hypothetical protein [Streptomyces sp. MBT65]